MMKEHNIEKLEREVNDWLAGNGKVQIRYVCPASFGVAGIHGDTFGVCIFYEE